MVSLASSSLSFLSKPSLIFNPIRAIPRISCSLSSNSTPNASSSSSFEFNITFAPPKPKPKSEVEDPFQFIDRNTGGQLFIPWIVRGEDGNLKLQSHPPTRFLHSMSEDETKPKKKKVSAGKPITEPPKHSKAARRFYNENIRESSQRLSKVLAAAGGLCFSNQNANSVTLHSFLCYVLFSCWCLVLGVVGRSLVIFGNYLVMSTTGFGNRTEAIGIYF